ncbi:hypothetical protein RAS1_14480 [Phycisphaerae bacterium RAS1]|nr:hypothetical protein RAS1_14480 [Phycisphaerae bacterium RAS1]
MPVSSNGCGSYYGVPTQNDFGDGYPVLFFDHEIDFDHPQYVVSSAIEMFVQFMLEKELGETLWPFDKAYVLEIDPQIVRVRGAPLPWCVE